MIIKISVTAPPSFIHENLVNELRQDLRDANIYLEQFSVADVGDDKVTGFAVIAPGPELADLTNEEIAQIAVDAVN